MLTKNNKITSLPRHDDQLNGLLVRSALNVRGCFCALLVTPVRQSTAAATASVARIQHSDGGDRPSARYFYRMIRANPSSCSICNYELQVPTTISTMLLTSRMDGQGGTRRQKTPPPSSSDKRRMKASFKEATRLLLSFFRTITENHDNQNLSINPVTYGKE